MKKLIIGIALLLSSTVLAFPGANCPRVGECTQEMKPQSRYGKTTFAPGRAGSQRNFRHDLKRRVAEGRKKTREQKSKILYTGRYMNSMNRTNRKSLQVAKKETQVQKNLRLWKAKRMAKLNK